MTKFNKIGLIAGLRSGTAIAVLTIGASAAFAQVVPECVAGTGTDATQCGGGTAEGDFSVAVGERSTTSATSVDGVAIGSEAAVDGPSTTAIGGESVATGAGTTAIGWQANAAAPFANAFGHQSTANDEQSIAIGEDSVANGIGAIAIGGNNDADGDGVPDQGQGALTDGVDAVALGAGAAAIGNSSTAIGGEAMTNGAGTTAIGWQSMATAERAQAFGHLASATGVRSTAVGEAASASGNSALSFGNLASASGDNSAAIGNGATATRANQFTLGNADNTYTARGIATQESRDAQGTPVGVVTSDAEGNLAVDTSIGSNLAALNQQSDSFRRAIKENRDAIEDNKEGIAMAMALSAPYVPADRTYALSTSLGAFEGSSAMAVNMGYRISANTQLDAGVTYGFDREQLGGRVGITYAW